MSKLPIIDEIQDRFLRKIHRIFPWDSMSLQFIVKDQLRIDQMVKDYYKELLVYFPYPIGKIIHENIINNLSIRDLYKYHRCNRMHSFSEIEDNTIARELQWLDWAEQEDNNFYTSTENKYSDQEFWWSE